MAKFRRVVTEKPAENTAVEVQEPNMPDQMEPVSEPVAGPAASIDILEAYPGHEPAAPAEEPAPSIDILEAYPGMAVVPSIDDLSESEPRYSSAYGGVMVDPDSHVVYTGPPQPGPLTKWLQHQLECRTMKKE